MVTDQELIEFWQSHLSQNKERFKAYKYIILDHTELAKINIRDTTVDAVAELLADTASANPEPVVAVIAYATYGANLDLVKKIEKLHELFIYRSS